MYYALIMAGGCGARLWPLSRKNCPKQSLRLVGERTMFQHAVDRIIPLFPPEQVFIATRAEHVNMLIEQTPELPRENFIVEPEGRGTAPAIGLAAVHLRNRDPQAVMAVLTADHFISDPACFRRALSAAAQVAEQGYLVTLGIMPSCPSTGYGYIQQGKSLGEAQGFPVFCVERFIEKPGRESASRMLEGVGYCWNSGMFIWRASRILKEIQSQIPELYAQLVAIEAVLGTPEYPATLARTWRLIPRQTIDYGVMEAAQGVVVIPVSIGWTDVGSWSSLLKLLPADQDGNTLLGPHLGIDTHDTLAIGGKRLIATIGVRGMVIVDTEDALLVCAKEQEQEVKEIVERLIESEYSALL